MTNNEMPTIAIVNGLRLFFATNYIYDVVWYELHVSYC